MYSIMHSTLHVHNVFVIGAAGIIPGVFDLTITSYSIGCLLDLLKYAFRSSTNNVLWDDIKELANSWSDIQSDIAILMGFLTPILLADQKMFRDISYSITGKLIHTIHVNLWRYRSLIVFLPIFPLKYLVNEFKQHQQITHAPNPWARTFWKCPYNNKCYW